MAKGSPRRSLRLSTAGKRKRSTTSDKESESKRKLNLKKRKERLSPLKSNKQLAILSEDSADPTMSYQVRSQGPHHRKSDRDECRIEAKKKRQSLP